MCEASQDARIAAGMLRHVLYKSAGPAILFHKQCVKRDMMKTM